MTANSGYELSRWMRVGSFLLIPVAAVGIVLAVLIWRFGILVPTQIQTDLLSTLTQREALEEIAGQRLQMALEAFRGSNDSDAGRYALETNLSEIRDSWPETLSAVRASQMRVAAFLQASGGMRSSASVDEILDEFAQRALARPNLYFADPVSYTSSYVISMAVSHLTDSNRKSRAWRLCRDVRWLSRNPSLIKEACDEVWGALSFPAKFWHSMDRPLAVYKPYALNASLDSFAVVFRNLEYRFNPYSGKHLRQLAVDLYKEGEYDLLGVLKGELLALDISNAAQLESVLAQRRGKRFSGFRFPDWSVRAK